MAVQMVLVKYEGLSKKIGPALWTNGRKKEMPAEDAKKFEGIAGFTITPTKMVGRPTEEQKVDLNENTAPSATEVSPMKMDEDSSKHMKLDSDNECEVDEELDESK